MYVTMQLLEVGEKDELRITSPFQGFEFLLDPSREMRASEAIILGHNHTSFGKLLSLQSGKNAQNRRKSPVFLDILVVYARKLGTHAEERHLLRS